MNLKSSFLIPNEKFFHFQILMQCGPKQLLFYERISGKTFHLKRCLKMQHFLDGIALLSAQSSLGIFAQK